MNDKSALAPAPSSTRTRVSRPAWPWLAAWAWLLPLPALGEEPPKPPVAAPVLNLAGAGFMPGSLADSGRPGMVVWNCDSFSGPIEFPLDEILSIRFPVAEKSPRAPGAFGFELSGGDVLYGSLVGLDEKAAELDVARLGRVRVERTRLRRIFRWRDGADLIHDGPNGLVGWREVAPTKPSPDRQARAAVAQAAVALQINGNLNRPAPVKPKPVPAGPGWVEDGRQLRATKDGATIQADVGLPSLASIDLELSWKQAPDFLLALGVSDDETSFGRAFRLEVWDGQIVAVRETDNEADLVAIQPVPEGPGRVRFQIFLDQELGKLAVYSEAGALLAELKLGGRPGPSLPGVRLTNIRGDLRLEQLRVARGEGERPRRLEADRSLVQLTDRSTVLGQVERFSPATREFLVRGDGGPPESRLAEDSIDTIFLPRPGDEAPRAVRVAYQDGTQLGGDWAGVEQGRLLLSVPGFAGPLRLPQEGLRSLDVPRRDAKPRERDDRIGELEMEGVRILGQLVDSGGKPGEPCLAWKPLGKGSASPIRSGVSGRIVYRRPAEAKAAPAPRVVTNRNPNIVIQRRGGVVNEAVPQPPRTPDAPGPPLPLPPDRRHRPGRGHEDRRGGRPVPDPVLGEWLRPERPGSRRWSWPRKIRPRSGSTRSSSSACSPSPGCRGTAPPST